VNKHLTLCKVTVEETKLPILAN